MDGGSDLSWTKLNAEPNASEPSVGNVRLNGLVRVGGLL